MEIRIAKIISILFQPLLVPTYSFLLLFAYPAYFSLLIPYQNKLIIFSVVFILTFLFPVMLILIMRQKGMIKSLQLDSRQERVIPFTLSIILYYLTFHMIRQLPVAEFYSLVLMGSVIILVAALIINFFWKISIHMIGIGGMLGAFIGISTRLNLDMVRIIILIILVAGITGFARLKLKAHTSWQVYAGFLAGTFLMFFLFLL
ncbi:MAG: hypothetical protein JW731_01440 [Bacteroidales bacterium]|nr:hypothetical protein [Bacteroidales bacterium]